MTDAPALTDDTNGTFALGGDLPVRRMGYGAMRITGEGVWGPPADHDGAIATLRRIVELGVNFIDTADSYGPDVSEQLIAEALHPYPDDVVVATKAGLVRTGQLQWHPVGRPEYLRQQTEMSLRYLKLDCLPLQQLHRIDPQVPVAESLGVFTDMQDEGKIRHIGISEVTTEELAEAQKHATIVSVQNRYNVGDREWEPTLQACEAAGIAFIPWYPIGGGELVGEVLAEIATAHESTDRAVALAWLLQRSPVMLPIPGTKSVAHAEANVAGAQLTLSDDEMTRLNALAG